MPAQATRLTRSFPSHSRYNRKTIWSCLLLAFLIVTTTTLAFALSAHTSRITLFSLEPFSTLVRLLFGSYILGLLSVLSHSSHLLACRSLTQASYYSRTMAPVEVKKVSLDLYSSCLESLLFANSLEREERTRDIQNDSLQWELRFRSWSHQPPVLLQVSLHRMVYPLAACWQLSCSFGKTSVKSST